MLFSCSKEQSVKTPISILVIPSDNSIFENRDARFLIVNDSNGKKVDKVRLRDNVDSEAKAFLFRPTNNYVLIDCDGAWYYINYNTGIISKDKNYDPWIKKTLPPNYIGTFMQKETKNTYFLEKQKKIDFDEIYKYGGGIIAK